MAIGPLNDFSVVLKLQLGALSNVRLGTQFFRQAFSAVNTSESINHNNC